MKKSLFVFPICALALFSCSLDSVYLDYEFDSRLTSEEMYYYTGDSIDKTVEIEGETISLMPSFFSMKNGEKVEDLTYGNDIELSGYDLSVAGEQYVTATCISHKEIKPVNYYIIVRELQVIRIEASDLYHLTFHPYKVGDKFEPITIVNEAKKGLSITIGYNDPFKKDEMYFADDEFLNGITYDLSDCKVDENNNFTEAGEFTVLVEYKQCFASYLITVEE